MTSVRKGKNATAVLNHDRVSLGVDSCDEPVVAGETDLLDIVPGPASRDLCWGEISVGREGEESDKGGVGWLDYFRGRVCEGGVMWCVHEEGKEG